MTDYEQLAKALRCIELRLSCNECKYGTWSESGEAWSCDFERRDTDAADAIEELQAEVDKANKSADAYRAMYFAKRGDITIEKVRELDEIDCHFHSALIRLMYRRIEELEFEKQKMEAQE